MFQFMVLRTNMKHPYRNKCNKCYTRNISVTFLENTPKHP